MLFTIRSDSFEQLQTAPALDGLSLQTFNLPPMPRGAYQTVIEGPAKRLADSDRVLTIEPALTEALLADIEEAAARTRCRCSPSRCSASTRNTAPAARRR